MRLLGLLLDEVALDAAIKNTLDVLLDLRPRLVLEASDGTTLSINNELGSEVPGDVTGEGLLEEAVDGVHVLAVHVALLQEGEGDTELIRDVLLDLVLRSRLLSTELVGREGNDLEVLASEILVDLDHFSVRGLGVTAVTSDVDDEKNAATKIGKIEVVALKILGLEVENGAVLGLPVRLGGSVGA